MTRPTAAQALYGVTVMLVLAAFVHLLVVWLVPRYATRDAFSGIVRLTPGDGTVAVASGGDGQDAFPLLDPATPGAVCRYDLSRGPARITLPMGRPGFLSLSLHAGNGVAFFALTDRAAVSGKIQAVLVTAAQLKALQAHDDDDNPSQDLRILAPAEAGFAFARALAETPGLTGEAQAAAKALRCQVEATPG